MIFVKLAFSVVLGGYTDLLESTSLAMSSSFLLLAKGDCLVRCISVTSNLLLRVHGDCALILGNVVVRFEFVVTGVWNCSSDRCIIGDVADMHNALPAAFAFLQVCHGNAICIDSSARE